MRSYTQMVVQCAAVQRAAVQCAAVQSAGCSMRSYTLMVVQRAARLGALLHPEISSG